MQNQDQPMTQSHATLNDTASLLVQKVQQRDKNNAYNRRSLQATKLVENNSTLQ